MSDMNCPYCEADQEVCHDDGAGYTEDEAHQHTCSECDKTFVFSTRISFDFTPSKADCLNGAPHVLTMTSTYPRQYSRMRCAACAYEHHPTPEEFTAAGISTTGAPK